MPRQFNKSLLSKTASSLPLVVLLMSGQTAFAQAQVIDEIVVTAQKRSQSVNDIGVSAVALDGDRLEALGVGSPVDLGAHTPGLVTVNTTSGGTPVFAIRGIGLDDFSPNNSSGVGVYTNEVFSSNPVFLNGLLFDVDRVEVLKGPQGTLYGFNTTGGAINFVTGKPTEETSGYISAGYGRFNTVELEGAVSGSLSDAIRGRIAGKYVNADGWQRDPSTGEEFGGQDVLGLRAMLEFDISDTTTALFEGHLSADKSRPSSPQVQGLGDFFEDPSFDALNTPTGRRDVTVGGLDVSRDENGIGGSLTINSSFEFADLVSITAYDKYDRNVVDNYGGSAASILDFFQDNEMTQFSQELRLVSNGSGRVKWVAGVNYADFQADVTDSFNDSFLVTDSGSVTFVLDPADIAVNDLDVLTADYVQDSESFGVYANTETEINENFTLVLGARYSNDTRSFDGVDTNESFGDVFEIVSLNQEESTNSFDWKVGLDWKPTGDTLVFANVSTSYKAGTYYGSAVLDSSAWSYIEPEDVLSYELGLKQTLLDGAMQFNASAFRLEYDNRQSLVAFEADDFSNFLTVPVVDTTLINIPKSVSQGFEVDLRWLPAVGFDITAGIAYLDAEITKGPDGLIRGISQDLTANANATGDLDGDEIINNGEVAFVDALTGSVQEGPLSQAPEWSFNAAVSYEHDISSDWQARYLVSYSYAGEQIAQLSDANARYGSIESLDGEISLTQPDKGRGISLWGRNLANSDAETYAFSSFAGRAVYRQKPTEYGIRFKADF